MNAPVPTLAPNQLPQAPKWTPTDTVALVFAFIGFAGGVVLLLKYFNSPPIVVSFFLATGVAALVYKFLGGVEGTSYVIGTLKVTGTLAALVGVAMVINTSLVSQLQFRLISEDDIVGPWKWVYAKGASSGHIYITKDDKGNLVFTGEQEKYSDEKTHIPLYTLTNGKAKLLNRNSLRLEADVEDHVNNVRFHWTTDTPLNLVPALNGTLRANRQDGSLISDHWGISIYKSAD